MQKTPIKNESCTLCPRLCHVNRDAGEKGFCGVGDAVNPNDVRIARAALHFWEEPCISGEKGSGTVFFSGCTMRCVYCQNADISSGDAGKSITVQRLAQIYLELQAKGAHNINLVTPTHYAYQIINSLKIARSNGLAIPIVYNTSGYERAETMRILKGYVDVYLPDFKYMNNVYAKKYSSCGDYLQNVTAALDEMVSQVGECVFDSEGIIKKGVIVRHMLLPRLLDDSKKIIEYLFNRYSHKIYLSIMSQYTPTKSFCEKIGFDELKRTVTPKEYQTCLDYAISLGIENAFIQEGNPALESFIPPFDLEGV